ncbi:Zonadhesin [Astathelohania contejeani]|uniref:Zonadhesin n=1 Tax=Astathelohania contejeani TaxID=164912 RepID=A0ABQ7HWW9_9MICR|nr:Zonadhesin [Thelohania contejeani]
MLHLFLILYVLVRTAVIKVIPSCDEKCRKEMLLAKYMARGESVKGESEKVVIGNAINKNIKRDPKRKRVIVRRTRAIPKKKNIKRIREISSSDSGISSNSNRVYLRDSRVSSNTSDIANPSKLEKELKVKVDSIYKILKKKMDPNINRKITYVSYNPQKGLMVPNILRAPTVQPSNQFPTDITKIPEMKDSMVPLFTTAAELKYYPTLQYISPLVPTTQITSAFIPKEYPLNLSKTSGLSFTPSSSMNSTIRISINTLLPSVGNKNTYVIPNTSIPIITPQIKTLATPIINPNTYNLKIKTITVSTMDISSVSTSVLKINPNTVHPKINTITITKPQSIPIVTFTVTPIITPCIISPIISKSNTLPNPNTDPPEIKIITSSTPTIKPTTKISTVTIDDSPIIDTNENVGTNIPSSAKKLFNTISKEKISYKSNSIHTIEEIPTVNITSSITITEYITSELTVSSTITLPTTTYVTELSTITLTTSVISTSTSTSVRSVFPNEAPDVNNFLYTSIYPEEAIIKRPSKSHHNRRMHGDHLRQVKHSIGRDLIKKKRLADKIREESSKEFENSLKDESSYSNKEDRKIYENSRLPDEIDDDYLICENPNKSYEDSFTPLKRKKEDDIQYVFLSDILNQNEL